MTQDFNVRIKRFVMLDRLFWLVWLGLPVMIWVAYSTANDPSALVAQLPPGLAQCARLMVRPGEMSPDGRVLYWALFGLQISIYLVLLGALHLVVHRFARGQVFVSETLPTVFWLGVTLIVWPFLDTAATQMVLAALKARGDVPVYLESYAIDVAPVAVGLFLVALYYVLDHAIAMKSEHDLTI